MKKTLTVNLGGTVFHIDEDAYRLLDNYLCNLKLHFRKQEGAEEIVDDIENRISELPMKKKRKLQQIILLLIPILPGAGCIVIRMISCWVEY